MVATEAGQPGYISITDGREDHVHSGLFAYPQVPFQRPGVVGDVVGVAELQRIDEDADRHHLALGPGPGHEGDVAGVQGPHGGHEPDRAAGGPGPLEQRPEFGRGLDDTHRYTAAGMIGAAGSAKRVASAAPAW